MRSYREVVWLGGVDADFLCRLLWRVASLRLYGVYCRQSFVTYLHLPVSTEPARPTDWEWRDVWSPYLLEDGLICAVARCRRRRRRRRQLTSAVGLEPRHLAVRLVQIN